MIESHAVFYLYIFDSKPLRERDIKLNMRYSSRMTLKLYTCIKFNDLLHYMLLQTGVPHPSLVFQSFLREI